MDAGRNGKTERQAGFRLMLLAALVATAAGVSLVWWSMRQSALTNEALARAISAEKAAARVQNGLDQSKAVQENELQIKRDSELVRSKHRPSKADVERTRRLSEEIEGLGAIQEKIEQDLYQLRTRAARNVKNPKDYYPLP